MTMRKVRLKALKTNKFALLAGDERLLNRKDRIKAAIGAKWTLKEKSCTDREAILQLRIERACLKAQIKIITVSERGKSKTKASVEIATLLKRIDSINRKLESHYHHA
ncbi:hypothetical protein NAE50_003243 [Salmonella enterica]|nr:hypothetical protein [Salmonella enterica subsp. enterica serovar Panama]EJG5924820.1 hypothetical protein [Salmonella enterica]ELX2844835.1 hypothetical protein [Salmonella enterica]